MSIFGERIAHPGPADLGLNMVKVLSDYAKKDYVDEQLALRVLKTGDTMTGDLTMARGLIRGLPLTQPMDTTTKYDEAISSYHVIELINRAFQADRNARRPLITVYAEEYGSLTKGEYECGERKQRAGISPRGLGPTQIYEPGYNDSEQPALRGPGRNSHKRSIETFVRCNQALWPIL